MKSVYREVTCINLIDKKGKQLGIGNSFTKLCKELNIDYVWFDFHAECKNMKWGNLSKLITICEKSIKDYGFFAAKVMSGRQFQIISK